MIALMIMTLSAAHAYNLGTADLRMAKSVDYGLAAQNLAEAGLAEAQSILKANFNDYSNSAKFPKTTLGDGTYQASVTKIGSRYLVSSTGIVNSVQRVASAEVSGPGISALNFILAGGTTVDLKLAAKAQLEIQGNIYAGKDIELKAVANDSQINIHNSGNIYAAGLIKNLGGNIQVDGTQTQNYATTVTFPVIDFAAYQARADANNLYLIGDQEFKASNPIPAAPPGGVIFVKGNITITSAQSTTACIIATGNITITKGQTSINQYTDASLGKFPAMMTQFGDITIKSVGNNDEGTLTAKGLVYAANNFSLSGNHNTAKVTGSILARGSVYESGTQDHLEMQYSAQTPPWTTTSASSTAVLSYNT